MTLSRRPLVVTPTWLSLSRILLRHVVRSFPFMYAIVRGILPDGTGPPDTGVRQEMAKPIRLPGPDPQVRMSYTPHKLIALSAIHSSSSMVRCGPPVDRFPSTSATGLTRIWIKPGQERLPYPVIQPPCSKGGSDSGRLLTTPPPPVGSVWENQSPAKRVK